MKRKRHHRSLAAFGVTMIGGAFGMLGACAEDITTTDLGQSEAGADAEADDGAADVGSEADDGAVPWGDADIAEAAPGDAELDAGEVDANPDNDIDAAVGSSCSTSGVIQEAPCGERCGTMKRLCLDVGLGLRWQAWGSCGEPKDACKPGEIVKGDACGFCGTSTKVCQSNCQFSANTCVGAGVCKPGQTAVYPGLSCFDGGVRTITCENTCDWGVISGCQTPPVPTVGTPLVISATVGGVVSGGVELSADRVMRRMDTGRCPQTIDQVATPYGYVEVQNQTTQAARVSIYHTMATGAPIDTIMAAYGGAAAPVTDAERKACLTTVNDSCSSDAGICEKSLAGLLGGDGVTIAAGGHVFVYSAGDNSQTVGNVVVNVRTDSLE